MIADDMMSYIKNDIVVFGIGVFVFIIFTLWFIFRNIKWVIMPLLGCATSVVIMIGLLGLIGWKVTVISSNFIALLLILKDLFPEMEIVVERIYFPNTPIDEYTLVIICSYSGNTEETLSYYDYAVRLTEHAIVLTTGGELLKKAKSDNIKFHLLPKGYPPRSALGFALTFLISLFDKEGVSNVDFDCLESFAEESSSKKSEVSDKQAEEAFKTILRWIGEDPNREGLIETPKRVIKAFKEYFKGYHQDAEADLSKTFGDVEGYDDMVVEKNITLESHCEHHMAPIIGVAHVAYIPNKKVVGLSKLARTVEVFSKRLQTQERLTMQVAKTLMNALDAKGVAVTVDAAHQCMTMRGIKKEKATTVTNYFLGSFREDLSIQNRYLSLIHI